jgi:hypothetical protein
MHHFNNNDSKNESLGFPSLVDKPGDEPITDTWPMPLHDLPEEHQIQQALTVVASQHPQIAKALVAIWGYQEGADYLEQLVFNGSDPRSHTREGFSTDVLTALLNLQSLHVVKRS